MSSPSEATTNPPRSRSRRIWLFRGLAIGLALLPFVALEGALRLAGYGFDTRLVIRPPQPTSDDLFILNPAIDRAYFGRGDLPGPEPRPFQIPKPAGLFRVVVVGGSSVAGFPYPFELSFPRHLEIVLQAQNPGRRFEVLNAGVTAINSFSEIDIARQTAECEPDLVILHSGHNEFYGVGGLASTAGGGATTIYPWLEWVRRQRVYQLGSSLVQKPVERNLLEVLPADIEIPLEGATFNRVRDYYRANVETIIEQVTSANVPLLLTTVPANLRDLSPMSSLADNSLTADQRSQQVERFRRIDEHLSYREHAAALTLIEEARQVEPRQALLAYRAAQCLERLQRPSEAADAYAEAADLDGCRFRAPSQFAEIVRELASRPQSDVALCDVAAELQARSAFPAPGNDYFLEHVHYNLEGHWTIALILAEFIQTEILHAEWNAELVPDAAQRDELLAITPFDDLVGDTFALMAFDAWPLNQAPDSKIQSRLVTQRLRGLYAALPEFDQQLFADLSLTAMQQDLVMALGERYQRAGEWDKAQKLFHANTIRRPWDARGRLLAAEVEKLQKKPLPE